MTGERQGAHDGEKRHNAKHKYADQRGRRYASIIFEQGSPTAR